MFLEYLNSHLLPPSIDYHLPAPPSIRSQSIDHLAPLPKDSHASLLFLARQEHVGKFAPLGVNFELSGFIGWYDLLFVVLNEEPVDETLPFAVDV